MKVFEQVQLRGGGWSVEGGGDGAEKFPAFAVAGILLWRCGGEGDWQRKTGECLMTHGAGTEFQQRVWGLGWGSESALIHERAYRCGGKRCERKLRRKREGVRTIRDA